MASCCSTTLPAPARRATARTGQRRRSPGPDRRAYRGGGAGGRQLVHFDKPRCSPVATCCSTMLPEQVRRAQLAQGSAGDRQVQHVDRIAVVASRRRFCRQLLCFDKPEPCCCQQRRTTCTRANASCSIRQSPDGASTALATAARWSISRPASWLTCSTSPAGNMAVVGAEVWPTGAHAGQACSSWRSSGAVTCTRANAC